MGHKGQLTAKESTSVEYYCNPDGETYNNWNRSYSRAGYSLSKGWKQNSNKVLHKAHIKKAIEEYRANNKGKIELSRQISLNNLQEAYDMAKDQHNPVAMISAEREKNAISALHTSTVLDGKDKQAKDLTPDQRQALIEQAKLLTKPKLVPFKGPSKPVDATKQEKAG